MKGALGAQGVRGSWLGSKYRQLFSLFWLGPYLYPLVCSVVSTYIVALVVFFQLMCGPY